MLLEQNLIEADAIIKKNVFRQSGNEKVIVGSKGYLFFSETLDDYLGQNTLSKREIYSCGRVLSLLQGKCGTEQQTVSICNSTK
ncbi:MAG: hypothetical protein ACLUR5_11370 [Eubacterium ventriosum]